MAGEITCFTCEPLAEYADLANGFARNLADVLQGPIGLLFLSLSALWIVLGGYSLLLGKTEAKHLTHELVFVIIAAILLGPLGPSAIESVYNMALEMMAGSSNVAFQVTGAELPTNEYEDLPRLAFAAERAFTSVFFVALSIAGSGGFSAQVVNTIYAFVLVLPYVLLVIAYSSQVVIAIFRVVMLAVFAPFLFMAFAFGWGHGMFLAGCKTLIGAILVLFASTVAVSLTIFGVTLLKIGDMAETSEAASKLASLENPQFLVILFMGWAGTAFLAEGTGLANSITHAALTNTGAGIMTAGLSGSVGAIGRGVRNPARLAAGTRNWTRSNVASPIKSTAGAAGKTVGAGIGAGKFLAGKIRTFND